MKKWLKTISLGFLVFIIFSLSCAFVYERISRKVVESRFSPEGEMVDVGDHQLHILKQGSGGPTVVFESGLDTFGHLSWYKIEKEVSQFTTTVSYDRAGVLWSDRGSSPKTSEAMTNELTALLTRGGYAKPYILVGHSIAGITLRDFVSRNKEDIAGILFVDASNPDQVNRIPPELNQFPARWLVEFASSFGILRLLSADKFPNTNSEDQINIIGPALIHSSIGAAVEEMENVTALANEGRKITTFGDIPLIVITGTSPSRNDSIPLEYREDMTRIWSELQKELLSLSSDSKQILAPQSGHYIQLDQPEIVIAAINLLIENAKLKK